MPHTPSKETPQVSGFSADVLELLEYDFTGFPSNSGGQCSGKGIVPEPTQTHLETYATALQDLFGLNKDDDKDEVEEKIEKTATSSEEKSNRLLELTSDLCQQTPSAAELKELPPRIRNAFMKWVYKELSDPKV